MNRKFLTVILLFAIVQQALSHGWLNVPIPRGFLGDNENSGSKSGPCGLIGDYNVTVNVAQNDLLPVDWTLGNGHDDGAGQSICRFSISTTDNDQVSFDANILLTGITCVNSNSPSQADVPIGVDPGIYYIQFHWFAGDTTNWYSCARINVTEGTKLVVYNSNAGTQVETAINAPELGLGEPVTVFHSVTVPSTSNSYYHLLVKFNQTVLSGELNLTVNTVRPKTYNVGSYKLVHDYVQTINYCNIPTDTKNLYVSMFADPTYVGNVSFTAQLYDGELNFVDRSEFEIHAASGDIMYFRTSAYSETTSTRRLVIWGRGGFAYTSGPLLNCRSDSLIESTEPNYCIDLPVEPTKPENPQLRYYGVYFDGPYDGKVMLQKGNCASYSGVETLLVSLLSILAAILLI